MISLPSLFSLSIQMFFNDTYLASGTGFLMPSSSNIVYLITNRHNVTGRHNETDECLSSSGAIPNRIEISHITTHPAIKEWSKLADRRNPEHFTDEVVTALKDRTVTNEPLYDETDESESDTSGLGKPLWFEHPALKNNADLVALKITNQDGIAAFLFEKDFSEPLNLQVTETVSVIGYPFGKSNNNFPVWTNGTLASDPILNYNDLPILLVDCPTRSGQSGSPVFRYVTSGMVGLENRNMVSVTSPKARFVGIYSGRIHGDSTIGMVWKSSVVYELLDSLP